MIVRNSISLYMVQDILGRYIDYYYFIIINSRSISYCGGSSSSSSTSIYYCSSYSRSFLNVYFVLCL
jgi:hypothetical protein